MRGAPGSGFRAGGRSLLTAGCVAGAAAVLTQSGPRDLNFLASVETIRGYLTIQARRGGWARPAGSFPNREGVYLIYFIYLIYIFIYFYIYLGLQQFDVAGRPCAPAPARGIATQRPAHCQ